MTAASQVQAGKITATNVMLLRSDEKVFECHTALRWYHHDGLPLKRYFEVVTLY